MQYIYAIHYICFHTKFEEIEEGLVWLLKHARSQNMPILGMILKEKAMEIAEELSIEDFVSSNSDSHNQEKGQDAQS